MSNSASARFNAFAALLILSLVSSFFPDRNFEMARNTDEFVNRWLLSSFPFERFEMLKHLAACFEFPLFVHRTN